MQNSFLEEANFSRNLKEYRRRRDIKLQVVKCYLNI